MKTLLLLIALIALLPSCGKHNKSQPKHKDNIKTYTKCSSYNYYCEDITTYDNGILIKRVCYYFNPYTNYKTIVRCNRRGY